MQKDSEYPRWATEEELALTGLQAFGVKALWLDESCEPGMIYEFPKLAERHVYAAQA